jgi:hypothetical protein
VLEGERFHFVHEGNFFCVDVAPVMVEDGGRWTCMAEGTGGRASCSSNLNVLGESKSTTFILAFHRTSRLLHFLKYPLLNLVQEDGFPEDFCSFT